MNQLSDCLEAISRQKTSFSYEVIVINAVLGSRSNIIEAQYSDVIWLSTSMLNPYYSRNKGIKNASGDILAFLDAKSIPCEQWLDSALTHMRDGQKKIIAGKYDVIPPSDQLRDLIYALLYLNNEKNVKKQYGVTTGNLFVPAAAFEKIGPFDDNHVSGNDIKWTRQALEEEYEITYTEDVCVTYQGQSYRQLNQSVAKYISGVFQQNIEGGYGIWNHWGQALKYFSPMRISNFVEALKYRGLDKRPTLDKCYLWLLVWSMKIRMARHYLIQLINK